MSIAWAIAALVSFAGGLLRVFGVLPGDYPTALNTGLLCLVLMKMGDAK